MYLLVPIDKKSSLESLTRLYKLYYNFAVALMKTLF